MEVTMTDLLEIPPWLLRGSAEHEKLLEELAAKRAANPPPPRPPSPRQWSGITKVTQTATQKKRTKKSREEAVRNQLVGIGFSRSYARDLPISKAKRILDDVVAGRGCSARED
jgi:hypothetical protein